MSPPPGAPRADEDAEALAAYAAGDPAAARALVARLSPRLLALCVRMLGDRAEAEDVTQEALLRLWRIAPDWRPGEALVASWVHRVAANLCVDRLRRRGRSAPLEAAEEPADESVGALDGLRARERAAALRAALADLPERQRLAISMRHFGEASQAEIAAALDVSEEAAESLLARGRRGLAKALAPMRAALDLS